MNARSKCLAGLGERTFRFGADGTPRALFLLVPAWRRSGLGLLALRALLFRGEWRYPRTMPCEFWRMDSPVRGG